MRLLLILLCPVANSALAFPKSRHANAALKNAKYPCVDHQDSPVLECVCNHPLLSFREEVELGRRVQSLTEAETERQTIATCINRTPTIQEWADGLFNTTESTQEQRIVWLARRVRTGDEAKAKMVKCNMRLVVSIAYGFMSTPDRLVDLVHQGTLGLVRSIEKYDPDYGVRFSTYATYWIRHSIRQWVLDWPRTIRLPSNAHADLLKISRATTELVQKHGYMPTETQIRECLNMPSGRFDLLRRYAKPIVPLDAPFCGDLARFKIDIAGNVLDPYGCLEIEECSKEIERAIAPLSKQERMVIEMRFGICGQTQHSFKQIATRLGIPYRRTRTTYKKAIRFLQHPDSAGHLQVYVDGDTCTTPRPFARAVDIR